MSGFELIVTTEGAPKIEVAGVRYPLVITVAGFKRWSEHRGIPFTEVLDKGWDIGELSPDDLAALLRIGLDGGELRRRLTEAGGARDIDDAVIAHMLDLYHPFEIGLVLALAWNGPSGPSADPQAPPAPSTGETSSDSLAG